MKETNHFIIYYNDKIDYIEKLLNNLEKKLNSILSFFEVQEVNKKIIISLISNKEDFDNIFYDIHKFKADLNSIGFYHNGKITYLSFSELNKTNHKNDSFESYINILKIALESYIKASGEFKSVRNCAIYQSIVNLTLSLISFHILCATKERP